MPCARYVQREVQTKDLCKKRGAFKKKSKDKKECAPKQSERLHMKTNRSDAPFVCVNVI